MPHNQDQEQGTAPAYDTANIQREVNEILLLRQLRRMADVSEQQDEQEPSEAEDRSEQHKEAAPQDLPQELSEEHGPGSEGSGQPVVKGLGPAKIAEVRAFVQTSFLEFDRPEQATPERRFVVNFPEEVYHIGRSEQNAPPEAHGLEEPSDPADPPPEIAGVSADVPDTYDKFLMQEDSYPDYDRSDHDDTLGALFEDTGAIVPKRQLFAFFKGRKSRGNELAEADRLFEDPVALEASSTSNHLPVEGLQETLELAPILPEPLAQGDSTTEGEEDALDRKLSLRGLLFRRQSKLTDALPAAPHQEHPFDSWQATDLSHLLQAQMHSLTLRVRALAALTAITLTPLLWQTGLITAAALQRAAFSLIASGCMALALLLCYDLFPQALREAKSVRPGVNCLVLAAGILALLHALLYGKTGPVYTAYPTLLLYRQLANRRARVKKQRIDCKLVCSDHVKRVPVFSVLRKQNRDRQETQERILRSDRQGRVQGYFARETSPSIADRLAPWMCAVGAASVLVFWLFSASSDAPQPFLTVALAAVCCVAPYGMLSAFEKPYIRLSDHLRRRGATIAGAASVEELGKTDEVLISDFEFFGSTPPTIAGVKLYRSHQIEEAVLVTASMAQVLNLPVQKALLAMIDNRADRLMSMTEVKHLEGGGIKSFINGSVAVLGTETFLKAQSVHFQPDEAVRQIEGSGRVPLYLAVGGHLAAVFSVDYAVPAQNVKLLQKLTSTGVGLTISTMDPLLSGRLAEWIAGLDKGSVHTVHTQQLEEIEQATPMQPIKAASNSSNPMVLLRIALAALYIRNASIIGSAVTVLAAAAGVLSIGVMLRSGVFAFANLAGLMLFELAWVLPVWCVSLVTSRMDQ